LAALDTTMRKLRETAGPARDIGATAQGAGQGRPGARRRPPLVSDLRAVLRDARHRRGLVPAADDLTDMSDNLRPVLDRINGPIRHNRVLAVRRHRPTPATARTSPSTRRSDTWPATSPQRPLHDPNGAGGQPAVRRGRLAGRAAVSLVQMFDHLAQTGAPPSPALPSRRCRSAR